MNLFGQFHLRHLRSFLFHAKNVKEINVPTRKKNFTVWTITCTGFTSSIIWLQQWLLQEAVNSIFDICNDNLESFNREKNEASVPVFYADWTSVPVPRTSSLRGLDVGFIPLLPKELPYMANNDEYTDEYNDEYLCRDFFVGFNFWSRLSFQISEFRVHWPEAAPPVIDNSSVL